MTYLAATKRLAAKMRGVSALEVRCPIGCPQRILILRRRGGVHEAIERALRVHYRYDCLELNLSHNSCQSGVDSHR
jgi:hypothetical protein